MNSAIEHNDPDWRCSSDDGEAEAKALPLCRIRCQSPASFTQFWFCGAMVTNVMQYSNMNPLAIDTRSSCERWLLRSHAMRDAGGEPPVWSSASRSW